MYKTVFGKYLPLVVTAYFISYFISSLTPYDISVHPFVIILLVWWPCEFLILSQQWCYSNRCNNIVTLFLVHWNPCRRRRNTQTFKHLILLQKGGRNKHYEKLREMHFVSIGVLSCACSHRLHIYLSWLRILPSF